MEYHWVQTAQQIYLSWTIKSLKISKLTPWHTLSLCFRFLNSLLDHTHQQVLSLATCHQSIMWQTKTIGRRKNWLKTTRLLSLFYDCCKKFWPSTQSTVWKWIAFIITWCWIDCHAPWIEGGTKKQNAVFMIISI